MMMKKQTEETTATTDFLRNVESSAKRILQKNNETRRSSGKFLNSNVTINAIPTRNGTGNGNGNGNGSIGGISRDENKSMVALQKLKASPFRPESMASMQLQDSSITTNYSSSGGATAHMNRNRNRNKNMDNSAQHKPRSILPSSSEKNACSYHNKNKSGLKAQVHGGMYRGAVKPKGKKSLVAGGAGNKAGVKHEHEDLDLGLHRDHASSELDKLVMDSSVLRKRFRCDERLGVIDHETIVNENCDLRTIRNNGDISCNRQHVDGAKAAKNTSATRTSKAEPCADTTSSDHPIEALITEHVKVMRSSIDRMTKRRLSTKSSDVLKYHLDTLQKEKDERKLRMMEEIEEMKSKLDENESGGEDGQNIPIENGHRHRDTKDAVDQSLAAGSDQSVPISRSTRRATLKKSSRIIPGVPPERWNLVVMERISEACHLSISRIHVAHSQNQTHDSSPSDDEGGEGASEEEHCWTFDFHDRMYQHLERYVLDDDDMLSLVNLIAPIPLPIPLPIPIPRNNDGNLQVESSDGVLVYQDSISRLVRDRDVVGDCYVRIHTSRAHESVMVATLSIHIPRSTGDGGGGDGQGEQHEISVDPTFCLNVPIYEIVAILNLQYLCKTLDCAFWLSTGNGERVWGKLIEKIDVVIQDNQGNDDLLIVQPSWEASKQRNVASKEESIMACHRYRNALKKSNMLLYSISTDLASLDSFTNFLKKEAFQHESRYLSAQYLEDRITNALPLSLVASKDLAHSKSLVPGACVFGESGPWRPEMMNPPCHHLDYVDATQASLTFLPQKDCVSPIVTSRVALETPITAPTFHVFDPAPILPSKSVDMPVDCPIPREMAKCSSLLKEKLVSCADKRNIPGVVLIDDRSLGTKERLDMDRFDSALNEDNLSFSSEGYRVRSPAHEVNHNSAFPLHKFGVSAEGVSPNETKVHARTIWHSEELCTQLLSKRRGSEDFFHMIEHESSGKDGGSPNDPLMSIIYMDAYKTKFVRGTKMKAYRESERLKAVQIEKEKKQNMIRMKLEAADCILQNRLKVFHSTASASVGPDKINSIVHRECRENEPLSQIDPIRPSNESEWRALSGPVVGVSLFELNTCKVGSYDANDFYQCTTNHPRMISIVSTRSATSYEIDEEMTFQTSMKTELIKDLLEDRFSLSHQINEGQRSKDVLLNSDQQYALEHILKVPLQRPTETEIPIEVQEHKYDAISGDVDKNNASSEESVLQATRHSNYAILEEMLDDNGVDIDISDEFGNTPLILASQQGNKKLCKFFLRRGAYINAQNHAGNTVLHYLHEYAHFDLADYMRRKGADDSYLNAEGLTCYEGVNKDNL